MSDESFSKDVFLVDVLRTPLASTFKSLKGFSSAQLAAGVMAELSRKNNLPKEAVDEVILGVTVTAGSGQNVARQAALLAGFPANTPAFTLDQACGSGFQAAILAARAIKSGDENLILAGGSESASQSPLVLPKLKKENFIPADFKDSLIYDGLTCLMTGKHMGELAEDLACKQGITRKEQDQYAFESHKKALNAQAQKKFEQEIVPVDTGKKEPFSVDERVRKNINLEKLAELPPAFQKNGTLTAGNSSAPCDGAAVAVVASRACIEKYRLKPKARLVAYVSSAVDPKDLFTSGVSSIKKCLSAGGLTLDDIDLFEIDEAFAVQVLYTIKTLNLPSKKVNIFGGDVALGHPLGAADMRTLATLVHALHSQGKKRGLASVCLGGGGAVTLIIEKT